MSSVSYGSAAGGGGGGGGGSGSAYQRRWSTGHELDCELSCDSESLRLNRLFRTLFGESLSVWVRGLSSWVVGSIGDDRHMGLSVRIDSHIRDTSNKGRERSSKSLIVLLLLISVNQDGSDVVSVISVIKETDPPSMFASL